MRARLHSGEWVLGVLVVGRAARTIGGKGGRKHAKVATRGTRRSWHFGVEVARVVRASVYY